MRRRSFRDREEAELLRRTHDRGDVGSEARVFEECRQSRAGGEFHVNSPPAGLLFQRRVADRLLL